MKVNQWYGNDDGDSQMRVVCALQQQLKGLERDMVQLLAQETERTQRMDSYSRELREQLQQEWGPLSGLTPSSPTWLRTWTPLPSPLPPHPIMWVNESAVTEDMNHLFTTPFVILHHKGEKVIRDWGHESFICHASCNPSLHRWTSHPWWTTWDIYSPRILQSFIAWVNKSSVTEDMDHLFTMHLAILHNESSVTEDMNCLFTTHLAILHRTGEQVSCDRGHESSIHHAPCNPSLHGWTSRLWPRTWISHTLQSISTQVNSSAVTEDMDRLALFSPSSHGWMSQAWLRTWITPHLATISAHRWIHQPWLRTWIAMHYSILITWVNESGMTEDLNHSTPCNHECTRVN